MLMEITKSFFDKHSIKITIGVLITCAFFVINSTVYITNIVNTMHSLESIAESNKSKILELEKRANQVDLNMVEIKTKLTSIESTLLDIKNKLK